MRTLSPMQNELWLRRLIWTDYRLAVLLTVVLPLILLIWVLVKRADALSRLLIIYWRVASLLAISVYLMIPGWWVGYLSGFFARVLIPISLWFWADLNEEIQDRPPSPLKLSFTAWRWAITAHSSLGAILTLPFFGCAFSASFRETPYCQIWLEAPWLYKQWFHPNTPPGVLGFFGAMGLTVYLLSLIYFLVVRLGKQGRSALEQ